LDGIADEVGTPLKHLKAISDNITNLSKREEREI